MPTEGDTELRRLEALDPGLFGPETAKLSPTSTRAGGQFPKKPRGYYVEGVRGGGLEPQAALEMIEEFQGQCCAVLHDVA
jgi:hypothetical protein